VKLRRSVIWALAAALLLGASAPPPRAHARATAVVGSHLATTDASAEVDHAPALCDTIAASVRPKAPTRSAHGVVASRRAVVGPTCWPPERAEWAAPPPVAAVPLYALHHVYRV
jgi:hypothetical protein